MSQIKTVQAFEGDWTIIEPPEEVGEHTEQHRVILAPIEGEFCLKSALAVSQAAGRHFERDTGSQVITFLSHLVGVPKPEDYDPIKHRITFYKALGAVGIRILKSECDVMRLENQHPLSVYYAELENPVALFRRVPSLHGEKLSMHQLYPQGPGYAVIERNTWVAGFTLGWCDPVGGRRSGIFVDTARIRREHPKLEPKLKYHINPGGL